MAEAYIRDIVTRIILCIAVAVGLSGCLFGKDDTTFTYTARVYGPIEPLGSGLGISTPCDVEVEDYCMSYTDDFIPFWPATRDTGWDELWYLPWLAVPKYTRSKVWGEHRGLFAIYNDGDTYIVKIADVDMGFPQIEFVMAYNGLRCSFSNPTGYRLRSNGGGDTVPVVARDPSLVMTSNTVRFTLQIDTAASRAADPRATFPDSSFFVGRVDVTCPAP